MLVYFTYSGMLAFPYLKTSNRIFWASLVAQLVKNRPAMRETWL